MDLSINENDHASLRIAFEHLDFFTINPVTTSQNFSERYPATAAYLASTAFSGIPLDKVRKTLHDSLTKGVMSQEDADFIVNLPLEKEHKAWADKWRPPSLGDISPDPEVMEHVRADLKRLQDEYPRNKDHIAGEVDYMAAHVFEAPRAFTLMRETVQKMKARHNAPDTAPVLTSLSLDVPVGTTRG